jgi:CheY-like chemotaxis protein
VIGVTPQADVPPKPVKVLFVEDEVLLRLMMADVLREEGFQWSTAAAWPLGACAQQGWPS